MRVRLPDRVTFPRLSECSPTSITFTRANTGTASDTTSTSTDGRARRTACLDQFDEPRRVMGEPPAMSLNGLKLCESQEIKRLKTLDLLSTTRPSGGTLPAPSTAAH